LANHAEALAAFKRQMILKGRDYLFNRDNRGREAAPRIRDGENRERGLESVKIC
jgi:hypothetical protein